MFDIGFSELSLALVVALIVLGPERLPKVARTVGRWAGQARAYMRNLSAELDRESNLADLKREFQDAQRMVNDQAQSMRSSFRRTEADVRQTVSDAKAASESPSSSATSGGGAAEAVEPAGASASASDLPPPEPAKPSPGAHPDLPPRD